VQLASLAAQPRASPSRYSAAVTTEQSSTATPATSRHAPRLVVALDGPGSSGKSTVGAEAACRLRYRFCDTGLLYRAVTWLACERGVAPDQTEALVALADEVELAADDRGRLCHVRTGSLDVTDQVHLPAVDRVVSDYAKVPQLRSALVARQRSIAGEGAIIMAGRDIGTVILPDADVKIYLSASVEERARRRATQRELAPDGAEAVRILEDLQRRDAIDSGRETAPLRSAADAVIIDTDGITFDDSVAAVIRAIREAEAKRATSFTTAPSEEPVDGF
jgi:cytidylate kinase